MQALPQGPMPVRRELPLQSRCREAGATLTLTLTLTLALTQTRTRARTQTRTPNPNSNPNANPEPPSPSCGTRRAKRQKGAPAGQHTPQAAPSRPNLLRKLLAKEIPNPNLNPNPNPNPHPNPNPNPNPNLNSNPNPNQEIRLEHSLLLQCIRRLVQAQAHQGEAGTAAGAEVSTQANST